MIGSGRRGEGGGEELAGRAVDRGAVETGEKQAAQRNATRAACLRGKDGGRSATTSTRAAARPSCCRSTRSHHAAAATTGRRIPRYSRTRSPATSSRKGYTTPLSLWAVLQGLIFLTSTLGATQHGSSATRRHARAVQRELTLYIGPQGRRMHFLPATHFVKEPSMRTQTSATMRSAMPTEAPPWAFM